MKLSKHIPLIALLALGLPVLAQDAAKPVPQDSLQIFYNPTWLWLSLVAVLFLFVIAVLGNVLQGLAKNNLNRTVTKQDEDGFKRIDPEIAREPKTVWVRSAGIIALLLGSLSTYANDSVTASGLKLPSAPTVDWIAVILVLFIVVEFFFILWLVGSIRRMIVANGLSSDVVIATERVKVAEAAVVAQAKKVRKPSIWQRFIDNAKPIEEEETIMFDHEYDGIKELDNSLPPWWLWGFVVSCVFGAVYLLHYHVFDSGDLSAAEYNNEMAMAEKAKEAYLKEQAKAGIAAIDETNAVFLTDASAIGMGKKTYDNLCASCHGTKGEGLVGPNLTDDHWLYGGSSKNIFKTVKYGAPKGMPNWEKQLDPTTIQNVISYVHSLSGTNPANAKAPEGEVYKEEVAAAPADSAKAIAPTDSVKK